MRTPLAVTSLVLLVSVVPAPGFTETLEDRLSLNASIGPSFAAPGMTVATTAGLQIELTDRVAAVGEFGTLPQKAPADAAAPPPAGRLERARDAFHWNGNLKVRPFPSGHVSPYLTAGVGSFTTDTAGGAVALDGVALASRRRASSLATNFGGGLVYPVTDWLGWHADYRAFLLHGDAPRRRVQRLAAGVALFVE